MPLGCGFIGTFLTLAASILIIFASIGNIRVNQTVPRHLRMAYITTYGVGEAVSAATGGNGNLTAIYGDATAAQNVYPANSGLRTVYTWGLWNRCGGYGGPIDLQFCTKAKFGHEFSPLNQMITRDVPTEYLQGVESVIPSSTFTASSYLGTATRVAFYFYFVAACFTAISLFIGLVAHRFAFLLGALTTFIAFVLLTVASLIWVVILARTRSSINGAVVDNVSLGINVQYGNALWILFGADAALLLAIIPFAIGCCTGRKRSDKVDKSYY